MDRVWGVGVTCGEIPGGVDITMDGAPVGGCRVPDQTTPRVTSSTTPPFSDPIHSDRTTGTTTNPGSDDGTKTDDTTTGTPGPRPHRRGDLGQRWDGV